MYKNNYVSEVYEDNGELCIDIPGELIDRMGWFEGMPLEFKIVDDGVMVYEKCDWDIDELLEGDNLENLVDCVYKNKKSYNILYNGRKFCLIPYE